MTPEEEKVFAQGKEVGRMEERERIAEALHRAAATPANTANMIFERGDAYLYETAARTLRNATKRIREGKL